jgi:hypothetical protein
MLRLMIPALIAGLTGQCAMPNDYMNAGILYSQRLRSGALSSVAWNAWFGNAVIQE